MQEQKSGWIEPGVNCTSLPDNIRLFGSEVMPHLRELRPETKRTTSAAAE